MEPSAELIHKARKGDIGAFEEIYRQHSGFVYNVAYRIVGNSHDAAEVTQDVFMKVYDSLTTFEFRSSLNTWLYRIAANTAINHYRRNRKHASGRVEFDPAFAYQGQVAGDPAKELVAKEEREGRVNELLAGLNEEQRACIVLREIEGLSYTEIAKALSTNINTVRSRLKRARERMLGNTQEEQK